MAAPVGPRPLYKAWPLALLLLAVACTPATAPERESVRRDPAAEFTALENRLLKARAIRVSFHVTAEGVVAADLHGGLDIAPAGAIRLAAAGHFSGQPVELSLQTVTERLEFGNWPNRTTAPTPAHLKEALLVGLTRMGILHNLARLTGTASPDHAEGGVREWVVVSSFAADAADPATISFELAVAGRRAGSASLEFDPHGHPLVRRQTVRFPSGEMRVVERYSAFLIEP